MIMAILIAAYFVNFVITSIGLSGKVTGYVTGLGFSPTGTMIAIVLFYLVLGMFMESLSMLVATVPIITPAVMALGFNPVWFGVIIMLLLETALITPPVGFNLFVVQAVRSRGRIYDVIVGSLPFVLTLMVMIALLIAFPQIALWLPAKLS
jgi:TRAP-type C4-dicarboxylate transport system permease large subunit